MSKKCLLGVTCEDLPLHMQLIWAVRLKHIKNNNVVSLSLIKRVFYLVKKSHAFESCFIAKYKGVQ